MITRQDIKIAGIACAIGLITLFAFFYGANQYTKFWDIKEQLASKSGFSASINGSLNTNNADVTLTFSAVVPNGEIIVRVDNKEIVREPVKTSIGNITLNLKKEGNYTIQAQQQLNQWGYVLESPLLSLGNLTYDHTAPNGTLKKLSSLPKETNSNNVHVSLTLEASSIEKDVLLAIKSNDHTLDTVSANTDGIFENDMNLYEGENSIAFVLRDRAGNESLPLATAMIMVDGTPPDLATDSQYSCSAQQEFACVRFNGEMRGPLYGTIWAPILGQYKNIKSLKINGKTITLKANGSISQSVALYVKPGENRYEVSASDKMGNTNTSFMSLYWSSQDDANDSSSDDYCTFNCSGHEAGYSWAEDHDISNVYDCDGNSDSFNEGCQEYVEENYPEEEEFDF